MTRRVRLTIFLAALALTVYGQNAAHLKPGLSEAEAWLASWTTPDQGPRPGQDLRKILTPLQFDVTQQGMTEPAYKNAYWDKAEPGLYLDVISGTPLFSSLDKGDSRTGWPSFARPLDPGAVRQQPEDPALPGRQELRGAASGAHLGDVFVDPAMPGGLRYRLNSAALRFVPAQDLQSQGLGRYAAMFQ